MTQDEKRAEIKQRINRKLIDEVCEEEGIDDEELRNEIAEDVNANVSENDDIPEEMEDELTENAKADDDEDSEEDVDDDNDANDEVLMGILDAQAEVDALIGAIDDPFAQESLVFVAKVLDHVNEKHAGGEFSDDEKKLANDAITYINAVSASFEIESSDGAE